MPLNDLVSKAWNGLKDVGNRLVSSGRKAAYVGAVTLILAGGARAAKAKILYVDDSATGANNGSSLVNAHNHLQDALAVASSGDEIRVAQGVYKPDQGKNQTPSDREATFQLIDGVAIKGGYAGFDETDPNDRDIDSYKTILSGDINGDDGPDFVNNGENSYHVVTGSEVDETAVLEGFIISGGNANGSWPTNRGGGMSNANGNPTLTNCTFSGNLATNVGGGMSNTDGNPTLTNCTFSGNSAMGGGGMRNNEGSPTLTNCIFTGNYVWSYAGGGMLNISTIHSYSNPILTNCTFSQNLSGNYGGGMYTLCSSPTLINCIFTENSAKYSAGGMRNSWSNSMLTNCTFNRNSARLGGAMRNSDSNTTLINCVFSGNSADQYGGAMVNSGCPTLTNCTITGNYADQNGGIYCLVGHTIIANSIIQNNTGYDIYLQTVLPPPGSGGFFKPTKFTGAYSCLGTIFMQGDPTFGDPILILGDGNIDANPCFVDPGYWDANNTPDNTSDDFWVNGDYHLKSQAGRYDPETQQWIQDDVTSPCIDAGNPSSPLEDELMNVPPDPNNQWGINLRINMGAYGGTPEASMAPHNWALLADLTNNGIVNMEDFAALAKYYLTAKEEQPGDLNRDGTTNTVDLSLLAGDYLKQTIWHEP